MMVENRIAKQRECACPACREQPEGVIAQEHRMINQILTLLNEKQRRRFVGLLAYQQGHGGIQQMVAVTGIHRNTIARGLQENQQDIGGNEGIRQPGGGRKTAEKKTLRSLPS